MHRRVRRSVRAEVLAGELVDQRSRAGTNGGAAQHQRGFRWRIVCLHERLHVRKRERRQRAFAADHRVRVRVLSRKRSGTQPAERLPRGSVLGAAPEFVANDVELVLKIGFAHVRKRVSDDVQECPDQLRQAGLRQECEIGRGIPGRHAVVSAHAEVVEMG